ncbi:MAG TPA: NfeD family protein [Opitutales bacterium]|nr:NfeD family protein [Opitutales bacterium]
MSTLALTLFVAGLILMAAEIIIPGGIPGTIGAICLLAGSVNVWIENGAVWGLSSIVATMFVGLILFFLEVRLMRKGPLAKWFFLDQKTPPTSSQSSGGLAVGTIGKTLTRLNPSGLVMVQGRRLEAISRDGMIEENADIVVVADDPFRIAVKRK